MILVELLLLCCPFLFQLVFQFLWQLFVVAVFVLFVSGNAVFVKLYVTRLVFEHGAWIYSHLGQLFFLLFFLLLECIKFVLPLLQQLFSRCLLPHRRFIQLLVHDANAEIYQVVLTYFVANLQDVTEVRLSICPDSIPELDQHIDDFVLSFTALICLFIVVDSKHSKQSQKVIVD